MAKRILDILKDTAQDPLKKKGYLTNIKGR